MKRRNKAISLVFLAMMAVGLLSSLWPGMNRGGGAKGEVVSASPTAAPVTGFEWRREGGIAGFCDVVTVRDDIAAVSSCRTEPAVIVSETPLTAEQSRRLSVWVGSLRAFQRVQSDGAVADGMTITLTFVGLGDAEPNADAVAGIEALANELLTRSR